MTLAPLPIPDPEFPTHAGVRHVVRLALPEGPAYAEVEGDQYRLLDAAPWLGGRPLGPAVSLGLAPDDLSVVARVNGEVRQDSRTRHLARGAAELVVFISNVMTLLPGDVISTGTPAGVAPLAPSDRVSIEIEGVP